MVIGMNLGNRGNPRYELNRMNHYFEVDQESRNKEISSTDLDKIILEQIGF